MLLQRVWGPERVGEVWLVRNVVKRLLNKLGDYAVDPRHIITELQGRIPDGGGRGGLISVEPL